MNTLREQALSLLDSAKIALLFEVLEQCLDKDTTLSNFQKEFIAGKTNHEFHERLRVWINAEIPVEREGITPQELDNKIFQHDYAYMVAKTANNQGIGTSDILQAKTTQDLEEEDIKALFNQERSLLLLGKDPDRLTAQEKLRKLSLADNGHLYKGTFLALGQHYQFQAVCDTASHANFTHYKGTEKKRAVEIASESVTGNLVYQYSRLLFLLRQHIPLRRDRSKNEDIYEVPIEALREFLANALVHRSYEKSIRSTIYVEIFDNRIEIRNPGTFPKGVKPDNVQESQYINPTIMSVFLLFRYAERRGTGIYKAQQILQNWGLPEAEYDYGDEDMQKTIVTIRRPSIEEIIHKQDPNYAHSLFQSGMNQFNEQDYPKARKNLTEAYQIFLKVLGSEHPQTKSVRAWLDALPAV